MLCFALPNYQTLPTLLFQQRKRHSVSAHSPCELGNPVVDAALRLRCKSASFVTVPKAAVHKNYLASSREYQVWLAGQVAPV